MNCAKKYDIQLVYFYVSSGSINCLSLFFQYIMSIKIHEKCKPGDTGFVHYSGHGGRVKDETGEDPSGYCSTLCPVDFDKPRVGQILDKKSYISIWFVQCRKVQV